MIRHSIIFLIMRYFISTCKEINKRKRKPLALTSFLKRLNYTMQLSVISFDSTRLSRFPSSLFIRVYLLAFVSPTLPFYSTLSSPRSCSFPSLSLFVLPPPFVRHSFYLLFLIRHTGPGPLKDAATRSGISSN